MNFHVKPGSESYKITVLLPVYNSEAFLAEAVKSILEQTFTDFELLVINDGSTDRSVEILQSFSDPRLRIVHNEKNLGLIATLNKGISLAKGEYIARMDADDIALPERLEKQLNVFTHHPQTTVVCSPTFGLTPAGAERDAWEEDLKIAEVDEIRRAMARGNCISHPTVMMRTKTFRKYLYNAKQKNSEDWDLWMRICADGGIIRKTKERLLRYRIHPQSVTVADRLINPVEKKILRTKRIFLWEQLKKGKLNSFWWNVLYGTLRTYARHLKINVVPDRLRMVKRLISLSPLKAMRQYKALKALENNVTHCDIFFFFPYCHIGGAERVHADIVEVFSKKKNVCVFFTGISGKEDFLHRFTKSAPSLNLGYCINYPWLRKKSARIVYSLIEKATAPVVFGCNSVFFYSSVLRFKKNVRVFDLSHDFRTPPPRELIHEFSAQFFRCEKRFFVSQKAIEATKAYYKTEFADPQAYEALQLITNYTFVPSAMPPKNFSGALRVLYVGRSTSEKRAWLFAELARACKQKNDQLQFTAVGELDEAIKGELRKYLTLTGPIHDEAALRKIYAEHHFIVITSEREGFPMAIMEGMAHGCIPVSSPVGDVPKHIRDEYGFVSSSIEGTKMLAEMENFLLMAEQKRGSLSAWSASNFAYAQKHFSQSRFAAEYFNAVFPENT